MPELYRSAHQVVEYLPEHFLLKQIMIRPIEEGNWSQHQKEFLAFSELVSLHKPEIILADAQKFDLLLVKDMQDWIDRNLLSVFNQVGLRKWAMVIPPQFLVQVGIEKTMAINPSNTFEVQYFETETDAMNWLRVSPAS